MSVAKMCDCKYKRNEHLYLVSEQSELVRSALAAHGSEYVCEECLQKLALGQFGNKRNKNCAKRNYNCPHKVTTRELRNRRMRKVGDDWSIAVIREAMIPEAMETEKPEEEQEEEDGEEAEEENEETEFVWESEDENPDYYVYRKLRRPKKLLKNATSAHAKIQIRMKNEIQGAMKTTQDFCPRSVKPKFAERGSGQLQGV